MVRIPIRRGGLIVKILEVDESNPLLERIGELEAANADLIGRINHLETMNGDVITNLRAENAALLEAVSKLEAVALSATNTARQAIRTAVEATSTIEHAIGDDQDPYIPSRRKRPKMDANEAALNRFAESLNR